MSKSQDTLAFTHEVGAKFDEKAPERVAALIDEKLNRALELGFDYYTGHINPRVLEWNELGAVPPGVLEKLVSPDPHWHDAKIVDIRLTMPKAKRGLVVYRLEADVEHS